MERISLDLELKSGCNGFCRMHHSECRFAPGEYDRMAHSHDELELNLGISGVGRYLVDGAVVDVRPGGLLWLYPEQSHLLINAAEDFTMWVVVIRQEALKKICREAPFDLLLKPPSNVEYAFLKQESFREVEALCRHTAAAEPASFFNVMLQALVMAAWDSYRHRSDPVTAPAVHPAVSRATRIIQAEPELNHVEQIASKAGMSRSQLSRLFRQQTGMTLIEYRQQILLNRFMILYKTGGNTLLEAALNAGFGSYPQFHRVFRKHYGCGPETYFRNEN